MIIFTKYSNDRRPELMIRTDIAEEGGVRTVIKAAADPRAAAHINGLTATDIMFILTPVVLISEKRLIARIMR